MRFLRERGQEGQAAVLLIGILAMAFVALPVFAAVGRGIVFRDHHQHLADRAALAAADQMGEDYWRLSIPPRLPGGAPNPTHLSYEKYRSRARRAAAGRLRGDGFAGGSLSIRLKSTSADTVAVTIRAKERRDRDRLGRARVVAKATAQLSVDAVVVGPQPETVSGGGYDGPVEYRQGKPMRPDVARAFDVMARAASRSGVHLMITSALRTDAEQARLFALNPDPRWVARPGTSLHRYGTELDLGPPSAYDWLAANARSFGFIKRYAWEPWHFGYDRGHTTGRLAPPDRAYGNGGVVRPRGVNPRDVPADHDVGSREPRHGSVAPHLVPSFVPPRYAAAIARAALRWNVSAQLLSAQLYAESGFDPNATSPAGARGIAQFMPGTARAYGLTDPTNPTAAINAQAHLMHDLLKQFRGNVALALAAYNAGPSRVAQCQCVPPFQETRGYVNRILAMLNGSGDIMTASVSMDQVFEAKLIE